MTDPIFNICRRIREKSKQNGCGLKWHKEERALWEDGLQDWCGGGQLAEEIHGPDVQAEPLLCGD